MNTQTNSMQGLRELISQSLDQPAKLESLYRQHRRAFQREFNEIYPQIKGNQVAQTWNERLNFRQEDLFLANKNELKFVLVSVLLAGLIAKIPDFTGLDPDYFFPRNIGFVVFPMLIAFFAWRQKLSLKQLVFPTVVLIGSAVYINVLPDQSNSDTLILAGIHLPLLLWAVLGFTFLGKEPKSKPKRIDFLRYNGDLVVMCALLALSGALFTGITFGLFQLIGILIGEFYAKYVMVFAAPAIPIVGTYLVQTNPSLVNRISPLIARIFTPIVGLMLLLFLGAMCTAVKNPYNDREFLMIFNALLIGVMALIVFSVTEATKTGIGKINLLFLCGLALLTIIANGVALSAIALRIAEFGITPNRLAVLGSNVLIFLNLLLVSYKLCMVWRKKAGLEQVEDIIAAYLPIYGLWTAFVTFLFPLIFNFR